MKHSSSLIALALFASLTLASCKQKNQTQNVVQPEVIALSDSLANRLDQIVDSLVQYYSNLDFCPNVIQATVLTESEKAAKPDYLLDPASVRKLVTMDQKLTALSYLWIDRLVLKLYDMPVSETETAIEKLMSDVNYSLSFKDVNDMPIAQILRSEYDSRKASGDIFSFWILLDAILTETDYVIACNPDLYSSRMTPEMWGDLSYVSLYNATAILAPHNERLAISREGNEAVWGNFYGYEVDENFDTAAAARSYYERRDAIIRLRNSLLQ